jgi:hypothetical protein
VKDLKEILLDNISLLEKSLLVLEESYNRCKKIGLKDSYSSEELVEFEALTSRFARRVDILTSRFIRSLLNYLREEKRTLIDVANYLEKLGLVDSADEFLELRDIRNLIAHEYVFENLNDLFFAVLEKIPVVFKISDNVINFAKSYL